MKIVIAAHPAPSAAVGEPDQADLAAQGDAPLGQHRGAHRLDHGPHVGGRAALVGLDEVGVLVRHLGGADAQAPQAEPVDDLARRQLERHRVHEHRAAVLAARLVLAPPAHDLGDLGLRPGPVAGRELGSAASTTTWWSARADPRKRNAERDASHLPSSPVSRSTTRTSTSAAAMSDPWPPAFMRTAPPTEPGHADHPLEPGQAGGGRAAGEHRQQHAGAGTHDGVVVDRDLLGERAERRSPGRRSRRRRRAGSSRGRGRAWARRLARTAWATRPQVGERSRRRTKRAAGPPTR